MSAHDTSRPLIIDPTLSYSTYLGGNQTDFGYGIAVDSSGNAYVTGEAGSANFPTTAGAFQTARDAGSADAFVTKLSAAGTLVYSSYLGGNSTDEGRGIAMDNSGNAYVTGYTCSTNFPTASPLQATLNGSCDAFVTKLNAAGSALVYSTYLGGSRSLDIGLSIAVDSSGNAYVTGYTDSTNFPTVSPLQATYGGGTQYGDAFVTKLNAAGSALIYSTYVGGGGDDRGQDIAVDTSGNAYVAGVTSSTNFPTANPLQAAKSAASDAFVTKLNAAGSALVYSTYLGGSSNDEGWGIAVDSSGSAYVTGSASPGFPTTTGAFDTTHNGNADVFVTKLNAAGSALVYSTYLGGSPDVVGGDDYSQGIAVDSSGNAYVTGSTSSTNFPTANPLQTSRGSFIDAFVTKLNAAGSALVYSTYLGGSGDDQGLGIAVDASGNAYVTGITASTNFPTVSPLQAVFGGGSWDAFVAKIVDVQNPIPSVTPTSLDFGSVTVGNTKDLTFTVTNSGGGTLTGSVTTSPPYSIVSGSSFSLTAGASQTVTVRFSPTSSGTFLSNASVSSNGGSASVSLSGTGVPCTYSISPTSQSFGAEGGTGSVSVSTQSGCSWTAVSNASWITITPGSSGTGSGTVSYSVASNSSSPTSRNGTLTIAGQTFTVMQGGADCTYSLSSTSQSFPASGGTGTVSVTALSGCPWTAVSNASWITVTSGSSGSGNGTVSYTVAANTDASQRTGTMTIVGQTFTVTQAGTTCSYSISPTSQSFGSEGGSGSVSVAAGSGCSWTATSNASWITITSGSSGSGNGTVSYSVAANTSTSSRTGTLTIAGQTFTVTQTGTSCTYSISSTSQSFSSSGGTGSVSVTAQSGCSWTATSNVSWITITSGSSGSGSGTVSYSVVANSSTSSRTGTLTIAGQTFTVTQAGISCTYSISPTSQSFSASGGTGSVSVTAQSGCSWTAVSNVSWITITSGGSGSGSGTVSYSVTANTSTSQRTGTLTIAGQTFTVTQAGVSCTYSISPMSQSFSASGGMGSVSVTASSSCSWTAVSNISWVTITSGSSGSGSGTVTYSVTANSSTSSRTGTLTIAGQTFTVTQAGVSGPTSGTPLAGDWNGDGIDTSGIYDPNSATFYFGGERGSQQFGNVGDIPITGDWNGDGIDTIGIYRPSNSTFYLTDDYSSSKPAANQTIKFGTTGDIPIVGDWNGDGLDNIGIFRAQDPDSGLTTFFLDFNNDGASDQTVAFGLPSDKPISGDWDGDGDDDIGVFRPTATTNEFHLDLNLSGGGPELGPYTLGNVGDLPITGDWDGDGGDNIGVYRPSTGEFFFRSDIPPSCTTYSIFPTSQSFGADGGTGSVSVTSESGCSWTAVNNVSWITITSGSSGTGSGTVSYSVTANTSNSSRTGTLTIAGQTFTVTQDGRLDCNYSISPTNQSFSASGGTSSVTVSAFSGCSWTAVSNASWITITSGSSGSGSGTVSYSVAANASTNSRTGTLTIAGQTFTVTQSGKENQPPVALFTMTSGSQSAQQDETLNLTVVPGGTASVTFSAATSFDPDPDGSITAYSWQINETEVSTNQSFTYALGVGTHQILLTIWDNLGEADSVGGTVIVNEEASASFLTLPFEVGKTWYVCNGYNGLGVHEGVPALDLSMDPDSFTHTQTSKTSGCNPSEASAKFSEGQLVLAPADGLVIAPLRDCSEIT